MKEEYKNLFEAAAKLSKPKKNLRSSDVSYDDLNRAYERCRSMYEEINRGIDFAFLYAKVEPHVLHKFLSHEQNFSQADWKAVQEGKTQVEEMMRNLKQQIGSDQAAISSVDAEASSEPPQFEQTAPLPPPKLKEEGQKSEQKKPRHIPRRNQWLDMH